MLKKTMRFTLWMMLCTIPAFAHITPFIFNGQLASNIYINGQLTTVAFNDGDTFKIKDGDLKQLRVRVVGINALENYGPVHQWAGNSPEYLFQIAKEATQMANRGGWHCDISEEKDIYGRLLAICDDLSLELIHNGLAHAYSITDEPARADYVQKQQQAQLAKAGMWKFGIPRFILTSLHSADEAQSSYNRSISAANGHSVSYHHHEHYLTCQMVCLDDDDSCMVYVPYEKRYGSKRPECLRYNLATPSETI